MGLQKAGHKAVNFDKLQEITQRLDENPAQCLARLMEALQKYTKLDPNSGEGTIVPNTHFISQLTPDIQKKLKKAEEGPQTPQPDLLNLAFKIFNNWEKTGKTREGPMRSGQIPRLPTALHGSKPPSTNNKRKPRRPCFKCGKEGLWAR